MQLARGPRAASAHSDGDLKKPRYRWVEYSETPCELPRLFSQRACLIRPLNEPCLGIAVRPSGGKCKSAATPAEQPSASLSPAEMGGAFMLGISMGGVYGGVSACRGGSGAVALAGGAGRLCRAGQLQGEASVFSVRKGQFMKMGKHQRCCGAVCASFWARCGFSGGALTRRERRPRRGILSQGPPLAGT